MLGQFSTRVFEAPVHTAVSANSSLVQLSSCAVNKPWCLMIAVIMSLPRCTRGRDTKRYSDPSVCLSVCLSHSAAAVGYRHTGCLQLSSVRTADPSADGRRSAASQTAIGGGISSRRPRGDNLLLLRQKRDCVTSRAAGVRDNRCLSASAVEQENC